MPAYKQIPPSKIGQSTQYRFNKRSSGTRVRSVIFFLKHGLVDERPNQNATVGIHDEWENVGLLLIRISMMMSMIASPPQYSSGLRSVPKNPIKMQKVSMF